MDRQDDQNKDDQHQPCLDQNLIFGHNLSVNDFHTNDQLKNFLQGSCAEGMWKLDNIDTSTSHEQNIDAELTRLKTLKSYDVLNQDTDVTFERITGLAARVFGVPICLVSIVDLGRQWFASNRGLGGTKETPRNVAFCSHAVISSQDMFIVPDTMNDIRFKNNPLVTGGPLIRFYAGVPLTAPEGCRLGTFCIIDTKPWPNGLTLVQKQNLLEFGEMVMEIIVLRKNDRIKMDKDKQRFLSCTAHEMLTPLTTMQLNLELINEDKSLKSSMNEATKETLKSTVDCVKFVTNICNNTINFSRPSKSSVSKEEVNIQKILGDLDVIIMPYRNKNPVNVHVASDVPQAIISDHGALLRSMLNLFIAAMESSAKDRSIDMSLSVQYIQGSSGKQQLLFECTKGEKFDIEHDSLRIQAASHHVHILGGELGLKPRNCQKEMIWFTIPIELKVKSLASTESSSNLIPSMNNNHNANMESPKDIIPSTNNDGKKRHIESPESNKEFFKKPRSNDDLTMSGSEGEEYNEYLIKSDNSKRVKCALIIDDTKIIRKTFERVLTSIGYTVKQANNGLQGLLQMKTIMFDVVFCDFLMPLMDGLDCVKQYRAWESEQRPNFQQYIIGISAHADSEDSKRGLKLGMNSFLPKPVLLKELKETLNSKEISEKTTCLDKISNNSDMRPFLLFANDVEVADDDNSLTCASDTENSQRQFTCLIAEGLSEVITTISRCVERRGWRTRVTRDGVEALQLMKMRNWDAIFIDENLCKLNGNSCVSIFRQWEATNRVAKQRNIHLVSAEFNNSNKRVPLGCDGALGTHFSQNEIVAVLKVGEKHQRTPTIL